MNQSFHWHIVFWLEQSGQSVKKMQSLLLSDSVFQGPFAFHPGRLCLLVGHPHQQYTCPRSECQARIQELNQVLSPHCAIVSECLLKHPDLDWHEFVAGYITIGRGQVLTNENSGHFGENWNSTSRQALSRFLGKTLLAPKPHNQSSPEPNRSCQDSNKETDHTSACN